ncbi:MAG: tRNA1(Val) (adenine(37)-N6)-methyltransferase [Bacteroidia bacterium]
MHESPFQFKQFTIQQDKCAMKVGTDGVLLGAWVQTRDAKKILDIGTGTGLIALMLAQKSNARIDAIDIDSSAYEQAIENFRNSLWQNRVKVFHSSIQQFSKTTVLKYDLIVSNPPFFEDAFKAGSEARNIARHTDETLSFDDLISCVKNLLKSEGSFCVILPFKEGNNFIDKAASSGLFIQRLTRVKTKIEKHEKRLLIEFGLQQIPAVENDMVIQEEDLSFTKEYIELTKDYYLGLKNPVA